MSGEMLWPMLQAVGALMAVLGLAWLLARAARHSGLAGVTQPQGRMTLEASLAIDARRRVVVLRIDGREVMLVAGPNGDTLLGWLPPP
jgi:flagellar protein FliO/FliZ